MAFHETGFPGLVVFEPNVFGDERGYFLNPIISRCLMLRVILINGFRIINPVLLMV